MSRLLYNTLWVFRLTILCLIVKDSVGNGVPVLLWGGEAHISQSDVNPLQKTSRPEFEKILIKKIGNSPWPVLVFFRNSLCVEDVIQHREELSGLNDIDSLEYIPAVDSPFSVFEDLPLYNVTVEDDVEIVMENQLILTPTTDLSTVIETYNIVRNSSPNLIAALTGRSCIYSRSERFKRETDTEKNTTEIVINKDRFLVYTSQGMYFKKSDDDEEIQLGIPDVSTNGDGSELNPLRLVMTYTLNTKLKQKLVLRFTFFEKSSGYWTHENVKCTVDTKEAVLKSEFEIVFPFNFSFHCSKPIIYHNGVMSLTLPDLQIQIDAWNATFNDSYDCIGFTTIPIWTGLVITVILTSIIMWGLIMIMDIRTMDRFDDPKGKTITIFAQD